jgi:hypothetical protein
MQNTQRHDLEDSNLPNDNSALLCIFFVLLVSSEKRVSVEQIHMQQRLVPLLKMHVTAEPPRNFSNRCLM